MCCCVDALSEAAVSMVSTMILVADPLFILLDPVMGSGYTKQYKEWHFWE